MAQTLILSFEVFRGSEFILREQFTAEGATIGKGAAATIRIEDEALADLQALIKLNDDGTVQLLDLIGEGLKVNGAKVVNAPLNDGDTIEIGEIKIVVSIGKEDSASNDEPTPLASQDENAPLVAQDPPNPGSYRTPEDVEGRSPTVAPKQGDVAGVDWPPEEQEELRRYGLQGIGVVLLAFLAGLAFFGAQAVIGSFSRDGKAALELPALTTDGDEHTDEAPPAVKMAKAKTKVRTKAKTKVRTKAKAKVKVEASAPTPPPPPDPEDLPSSLSNHRELSGSGNGHSFHVWYAADLHHGEHGLPVRVALKDDDDGEWVGLESVTAKFEWYKKHAIVDRPRAEHLNGAIFADFTAEVRNEGKYHCDFKLETQDGDSFTFRCDICAGEYQECYSPKIGCSLRSSHSGHH
jgi:pSer/pThr/pTyr-binding forkhead associated (FHA) protein